MSCTILFEYIYYCRVGADHGQEEENDTLELINNGNNIYHERNGNTEFNSKSSETRRKAFCKKVSSSIS